MKIITKKYYYFDTPLKSRLYRWLLKNDYTQKELASLLNISQQSLSLIINGDRAITKEFAEKLKELGFEIKIRG